MTFLFTNQYDRNTKTYKKSKVEDRNVKV